MPAQVQRPWKIFLPMIVVLALAALWSIYWAVAADWAKSAFADRRQLLADRGIMLECTQEDWGGFPFRFEFNCTSPVLTYNGKAEAQSVNLLAIALAYNPWQVVLLLDGPTIVSGPGLIPTTAEHQRAIASITVDRRDQNKISFDIETRQIHVPDLLSVDRVLINTRTSEKAGNDFAVLLERFSYQPHAKSPFGIDRVDLLGSLSPERTLNIAKIELRRNEVRCWGSGTAELDRRNRISGKLAAETNDLAGLLSLLEPQLNLSGKEMTGLRTMLSLFGNNAKADLIAQEGRLLIGPVQIADLVPLF